MYPSRRRRTLRSARFRFGGILVALLLAGCGGDSQGPPPTITVSGYGGPLTFIGATVQLTASSSAGSVGGVQWTTSNRGVASVSGSGLVTAVAPGTAVVSAQGGGAAASVSIMVAPAPASLVARSGDTQTGTVGDPLPAQLSVEVRDEGGTPIAGTAVTFQPSVGGTVSATTTTTDGQGQARTSWTLAITSGTQTLQASSGGQAVVFSATALPGAPTALLAQVGNGQTGLAGVALPAPIRVLVADAFGNGVPGVSVGFTPAAGSGSVSEAAVVSGSQGLATSVWTLGRYAGDNTLTVQAPGLGATSFMATGLPNGIVTGIANATGNWYAAPPAPSGALGASSTAKLSTTLRAPERLAPAPVAFALPGGALLVRLRKPDLPSFFQSATSRAVAEAQAGDLRAVTEDLAGRGSFEVQGVSPAIRTVRLSVDAGVDRDALLRTLANDPRVERVEPDGVAYAFGGPERTAFAPTSEPLYPWQAWHYESIGLEEAWKFTRGDPNVVVAVVDDGIRFDHPDLAGALLPDGFDFVQAGAIPLCAGGQIDNAGDGDGPDPDPTIPTLYHLNQSSTCVASIGGSGGHGTHVSGTIAARDGTGGGVGVAPGVSILPVRVMGPHGSGSLYDIAQGILYAAGLPADGGPYGMVQNAYGAHVINLSLGGSSSNGALQAAVEAATAAGSLVVAAAGNEGTSTPNYPAAYPDAMSVSAVGPSWVKPGYSSFGSTVEISAPGGAVGDAGGNTDFGVWSTIWDFDTGAPAWAGWQGTSMASPHVAGVAALLFSQNPTRSAAEVRSLLKAWSRDLGPAGWDATYGYGMLDALSALTLGAGVPGQTWVALFDAVTGAAVDVSRADPDGGYAFGGLADGDYFVYAGLDEFGDGLFGLPPQPFSAFGGGSTPTPITIDGAGERVRSFNFGRPLESEPNRNAAEADQLMIGGYVGGLLDGGADVDFYRITVAEAGSYRFETYGLYGACGFAVVPDTVLHLHDAAGIPITSSDDIDTGVKLFCSRIQIDLVPGTYFLRVSAFGGAGSGGLYGLWASRSG